jgi:hypothetical protein
VTPARDLARRSPGALGEKVSSAVDTERLTLRSWCADDLERLYALGLDQE